MSIVFTLIVAMLLTTYFVYLVNSSVEGIIKLIRERNVKFVDCIFSVQYDHTKIVLLNRACIGEILHISIVNGTIYYDDEYVWIKTSLYQDIRIITREEVIVV